MSSIETLQHRKRQLVRNAIWDAAIDLFAEKGFDQTTIEEIALAAGVSRRSFFRYFASKDDLMAQGIVTYGTMLCEAVGACPQTCSLLDVVRQTTLEVAKGVAAQPRTRTIIHVAVNSPAARRAQLSQSAGAEDRVAQAFAVRCRNRPKDELTPRLLAGLTFAVLDLAFRHWFWHPHQDISATIEQIFATLCRLVSEDSKPREVKRSHRT